MDRRAFLAAAGAMTALGMAGAAGAAEDKAPASANQFLEWRKYTTLAGPRGRLLEDYLGRVAIPAWNRIGIGPVGVFSIVYGPNNPSLYVLLPHPSLESVVTASARLAADAEYMKGAAEFLGAPLAEPAFTRLENSLLRAFDQMPKVEVPTQFKEKKSRICELRIYESHSPLAAKKKLAMFNEGGEIPIFRRAGLQPVFFGETLFGPMMPNLQYMLCFDDMAQRDASWDKFGKDPEWVKLAQDPQYADTVSNITDLILRPTGYSQL